MAWAIVFLANLYNTDERSIWAWCYIRQPSASEYSARDNERLSSPLKTTSTTSMAILTSDGPLSTQQRPISPAPRPSIVPPGAAERRRTGWRPNATTRNMATLIKSIEQSWRNGTKIIPRMGFCLNNVVCLASVQSSLSGSGLGEGWQAHFPVTRSFIVYTTKSTESTRASGWAATSYRSMTAI